MSAAQIIVALAGAITIALAWFFFRSRTATEAVEQAGVQEVRVVVRGGYSPDVIRARTGLPLRIVFDRQEDGDCSSRVVFTDLNLSRFLTPFAQTTVEFTPTRRGTDGFACGMNMIHGTLLVEGDQTAASDNSAATPDDELVAADGGEHAEAAARRAEATDLSRRLLTIDGRTWWFRSSGCRDSFAANPTAFTAAPSEPGSAVYTKVR